MLQLAKQNHATIQKTMSAVNDKTITFLDNHLIDRTGPNEFWYNVETLGDINRADEILDRWSSDGTGYTLYMMNTEGKRTQFDLSHKASGFKYFDIGLEQLPAWTDQAVSKRGAGAFRLIRSSDGLVTVSFVRSILNSQNYNEVLGFLVVSRLEVLLRRDLLSVELPEHAGTIYLYNDQDELLMQAGSTDRSAAIVPESARQTESGYFFARENGERWLYAHSYEQLYHTNLVYRIPLDSITGSQTSFQWTIMILSAIYLALVLLFVLYLLRVIVKPLHRLVSITKIYEPGVKMDMSGELIRPDEFGILYGAFMRMTRRLDRSIEDNYLMKLRQQETELATLHSQITPHLLYNTLDSIYWYALDNGNTEVGEMVMDLSMLLRIGLSKGKTMIPIDEEVKHVQAYCRLQAKRYPGTFEAHWDIEEDALAYTTPKVIVQPLVENAIFHGVGGMDGEGEIWIRVRRTENTIEMTVEDNGFMKVDIDRLNAIVRGTIEDAGYGIRNVHKRVQLHYGESYGLQYYPREGGGVKAVITLPLRERRQDER
ncbi:sensor histidine kinase [Cohnella panacarvi]|uniref:sensor histidine kinase n=1 Tax=Cohnella panacarvi TaxID=400776 RepID=UPI00047DCCB1|nr:sensor histidine kinase [Cohnella panacarvi]